MTSISQSRLLLHDAIAETLLTLAGSGSGLRKETLKDYIVLERKLGKSTNDKNAVSFIKEGISFMVPDLSAKAEAEALGLTAEESKSVPRLIFPTLSLEQVHSNSEFFTRLTLLAATQAEYLQTH